MEAIVKGSEAVIVSRKVAVAVKTKAFAPVKWAERKAAAAKAAAAAARVEGALAMARRLVEDEYALALGGMALGEIPFLVERARHAINARAKRMEWDDRSTERDVWDGLCVGDRRPRMPKETVLSGVAVAEIRTLIDAVIRTWPDGRTKVETVAALKRGLDVAVSIFVESAEGAREHVGYRVGVREEWFFGWDKADRSCGVCGRDGVYARIRIPGYGKVRAE